MTVYTLFLTLLFIIVLYALSAWGGYLTRDGINRLNALFKKALRWRQMEIATT